MMVVKNIESLMINTEINNYIQRNNLQNNILQCKEYRLVYRSTNTIINYNNTITTTFKFDIISENFNLDFYLFNTVLKETSVSINIDKVISVIIQLRKLSPEIQTLLMYYFALQTSDVISNILKQQCSIRLFIEFLNALENENVVEMLNKIVKHDKLFNENLTNRYYELLLKLTTLKTQNNCEEKIAVLPFFGHFLADNNDQGIMLKLFDQVILNVAYSNLMVMNLGNHLMTDHHVVLRDTALLLSMLSQSNNWIYKLEELYNKLLLCIF